MPSTFSLMDSNLPTLRREDEPEEQIYEIVNFLTIMAETLKYALNNLDTSNFNEAALSDYSEETTGDIRKGVQLLSVSQKELNDSVKKLNSALEKLEEKTEELGDTLDRLRPRVEGLLSYISATDESITIGGSGKTVNINGDVYINGSKK